LEGGGEGGTLAELLSALNASALDSDKGGGEQAPPTKSDENISSTSNPSTCRHFLENPESVSNLKELNLKFLARLEGELSERMCGSEESSHFSLYIEYFMSVGLLYCSDLIILESINKLLDSIIDNKLFLDFDTVYEAQRLKKLLDHRMVYRNLKLAANSNLSDNTDFGLPELEQEVLEAYQAFDKLHPKLKSEPIRTSLTDDSSLSSFHRCSTPCDSSNEKIPPHKLLPGSFSEKSSGLEISSLSIGKPISSVSTSLSGKAGGIFSSLFPDLYATQTEDAGKVGSASPQERPGFESLPSSVPSLGLGSSPARSEAPSLWSASGRLVIQPHDEEVEVGAEATEEDGGEGGASPAAALASAISKGLNVTS